MVEYPLPPTSDLGPTFLSNPSTSPPPSPLFLPNHRDSFKPVHLGPSPLPFPEQHLVNVTATEAPTVSSEQYASHGNTDLFVLLLEIITSDVKDRTIEGISFWRKFKDNGYLLCGKITNTKSKESLRKPQSIKIHSRRHGTIEFSLNLDATFIEIPNKKCMPWSLWMIWKVDL